MFLDIWWIFVAFLNGFFFFWLFTGINFGAAFKEPFNTFDPLDTSAWTNLNENPLIFSVMVALMAFYLCCLIWARRWDMKDTVAVIITTTVILDQLSLQSSTFTITKALVQQ